MNQSQWTGLLAMIGSLGAIIFTLYGAARRSYLAMALPVMIAVFVTGIIVADSTDVPGGGIGTITMTHFFDRDPSTARIRMLMNLGYFYRIFAINRSDSLQYILLMDPRQGLRNSYICFTESYVGTIAGSSAIIGMTYTGQWVGTETIQTAVGSFSTWLLEVRQTVTISSTPVAAFIVMRIWFAQGIGPVKMELSGNAEQYGHVRVLASKNF